MSKTEIEECEGGHPLIEGTIHCTSWTCANPECVEGHTRIDGMKINNLKRELEMARRRLRIYHEVMEHLQESRDYGRWYLGWSDGLHYPPPGTVADAIEEYDIPDDDEDWVAGFKAGQDIMEWS